MLDSVKSFVSGVSNVEGIDSVQRHKSDHRKDPQKDQKDQLDQLDQLDQDEQENGKILMEKEEMNETRSTPVNVDFGVVFDLLNGMVDLQSTNMKCRI